MRLARMIRKDTFTEDRHEVIEVASVLWWRTGDQRFGVESRERLLSRLVTERSEVIDDEIRHAVPHSAHRRVIQLEVGAKNSVGHGVETTCGRLTLLDQRPMEPLTVAGILVIYQTENSVSRVPRDGTPAYHNDGRTLFVSLLSV